MIRRSLWRDYYALCKPGVVALMLLTAIVGMLLATSGWVPLSILIAGTIGIGLSASAGAVLNHVIDKRIDAMMHRTQRRPIASGRVEPKNAVIFALILAALGMTILVVGVNLLTAVLTFLAMIGYAIIYTVFLKRTTSQNIVIGGLAGAMPPLLGWTAVTGHLQYQAWLLVLIIFVWTPPHFWALSIYRYEDYAKTTLPMLPVTHGIPHTKLQILLYTCLLSLVTLLPYFVAMSGIIYLAGVIVLDVIFLYWAGRLYRTDDRRVALKMFNYSIVYLMLLFILLLVDHYLPLAS